MKAETIANEIGASLTKLRLHLKKELGGKNTGPSVEMNPGCSLVNWKLEVEISTEVEGHFQKEEKGTFSKGGKRAKFF